MTIEVMKQALEALEAITYRIERDLEHDHEWAVVEREIASDAITSLRSAIEQAQANEWDKAMFEERNK